MSRFLTILGLIASVAYTLIVYLVVRDRLPKLGSMPLNEIGDFLAGVFGPLGLLWLVLGYLQQGIELGLNTKALELQALELKNSVNQQRELLDLSRKQFEAELEVLRHERHRADQAIKPRFVPEKVGGSHHSSGRSSFMWSIKNVGTSITNVSFQFSAVMQKVEPDRLSEWLEDQTVRLAFTFPEWKANDTDVTIAYTDAAGQSGQKVYALRLDSSGSYPKLEIIRPDL